MIKLPKNIAATTIVTRGSVNIITKKNYLKIFIGLKDCDFLWHWYYFNTQISQKTKEKKASGFILLQTLIRIICMVLLN